MSRDNTQNRKRGLNVYHNYFKRTGMYGFVGKTLIKLFLILAGVGIAFYFTEKYLIDFDAIFKYMFEEVNVFAIFIIFFISESVLGLIPPDLFIAWAKQCPNQYLSIAILSILSYSGGLVAYIIGKQIRKIPKINKYLERKFKTSFQLINKYGGFIIVFAAIFPLPFSTITMVAGVVHYPFRKVVLLGLFRFVRIIGYAIIIFWGLNLSL